MDQNNSKEPSLILYEPIKFVDFHCLLEIVDLN